MKPSVMAVDPETRSGAPGFAGTRAAVQAWFDSPDGGHPRTDFPAVTAEQAHQLLAEA